MKLRVALIYGGRSGEHEISLRSAKSIMEAMDPEKYKILHFLINKEGKWSPRPIAPEPGGNPEIDVAFPVLHGTFGEDGTVQGLLELAGIPYVGPGVMASAVCMDKDMMKRICKEQCLPVVDYLTGAEATAEEAARRFGFPIFVKPANLGSSVGISKARDAFELAAAIDVARKYDRKIIVERAVIGREFECSVMGNEQPETSLPCEILPSREFYDYDDKYLLDTAKTELPANLPPEKTAEMRHLAAGAYSALGCEGMARVDFLMENATGQIFINEVNTIPGFTSISMYPRMWDYSGLPMPKLIDRLITLAMERHAARQALQYTR